MMGVTFIESIIAAVLHMLLELANLDPAAVENIGRWNSLDRVLGDAQKAAPSAHVTESAARHMSHAD